MQYRHRVKSIKDIERLIADGVEESLFLDYKESIALGSTSEKKELLYDVSSFANTRGGTIIYGVREEKGKATNITGIHIENIDKFKLQVESILTDGFEPRIKSKELTLISLSENKFIFVIDIEKGNSGPHQVILDKAQKYYARHGSGKFLMNNQQITDAILEAEHSKKNLTETQSRLIENLKKSENHPVRLATNPLLILQIFPQNATLKDLTNLERSIPSEAISLPPLGGGSRTYKYNEHGVLIYSQMPDHTITSFLQLYHNGYMETVNAVILKDYSGKRIGIHLIEGYLIREITTYLNYFNSTKQAGPFHVFITLTGLKGYSLISDKVFAIPINTTQKDLFSFNLTLHEESNVEASLQIVSDRLWQAFGYPHSFHYSNDNKWLFNLKSF